MSISVFELGKEKSVIEAVNFREELSMDGISRRLPQGLYSTFRTYAGGKRVVGLSTHLDRIYLSSPEENIIPSVTREELRQVLRLLLSPYVNEARVRICISKNEKPGQVFVIIEPLKILDETVYSEGIRVVISHVERESPKLKSTSFIIKSKEERKSLYDNNIFEGIIVKNNRLLEGLTSNFFALIDSNIITANKGILQGVTRKTILKIIRSEKMIIQYRGLRIDELPSIQEAFITSSSRGVVPVISIDGKQVGQGTPGPVSKKLRELYDDFVLLVAETI